MREARAVNARGNRTDDSPDRPVVIDTLTLPVDRWDDPTRGSVSWQTVLSRDLTPTSNFTLGIAEVPADGTVGNPAHRHEPAEFYFVLAGEGVVEIDGITSPVRTGVAVYIPGNAEHCLHATGDQPLRLLYGFPTDSFAEVQYIFSLPSPSEPPR